MSDKRLLCIIETRQEIMLATECVCPPIPCRSMDWSAIDSKTYDASLEDGEWVQAEHGRGETEFEATDDLIEQLITNF